MALAKAVMVVIHIFGTMILIVQFTGAGKKLLAVVQGAWVQAQVMILTAQMAGQVAEELRVLGQAGALLMLPLAILEALIRAAT
tara:strand:- start:332 stop:583 length:252 start_codon:yes stop_codon:yes gene_type:complete